MKKYLLLACCFIATFLLPASAQDCAGFTLKEGSGFEMDNFDAKGKSVGKIIYKVAKVSKDGAFTVFNIDMESFNNKGQSQLKNTYEMKCDGNVMVMDASALVSQEQMKSFQGMDMKFTYDNIEYPSKYNVGDKWKDASVKGEGKSTAMPVTFNMAIKNRTVVGQEKLTVPAGTFDAYKINADMNVQMVMGFPIKVDMQTISYRTPSVVWDLKTETYRKGKLMGYSELTKIY
ncbi:TapB family protein [Dyadobacter sp.]|uniref:TapB family protein n=1 Tax=Dyadobacter sp. TaxID=1914288 RepID=UPI003F6FE1ED